MDTPEPHDPQVLARSRTNHLLAGVCGGISKYFGINIIVVRVLMMCLVLTDGIGILIYVILWMSLPAERDAEGREPPRLEDWAARVGREVQKAAHTIKAGRGEPRRHTYLGLAVIVIGVFALARTLLPEPFAYGRYLWPAAIIGIGIYILMKDDKQGAKEKKDSVNPEESPGKQ